MSLIVIVTRVTCDVLQHLQIHSIHSYSSKNKRASLQTSDKSTQLAAPPKQHHQSDFMLNKIRIRLFVFVGWMVVVGFLWVVSCIFVWNMPTTNGILNPLFWLNFTTDYGLLLCLTVSDCLNLVVWFPKCDNFLQLQPFRSFDNNTTTCTCYIIIARKSKSSHDINYWEPLKITRISSEQTC